VSLGRNEMSHLLLGHPTSGISERSCPSDPPRPADSRHVKIESLASLPVEAQVSAAVARKALAVQKQLGEAGIALIEAASPADALKSTGDGRGQHIHTLA
jgi:hypothetical protein